MTSTAPFDGQTTIGAYQVGVLIAFVLFGIMTTQMYIYYNRFPDDNPRLKILVTTAWYGALSSPHIHTFKHGYVSRVIELAHAICIANVLYTWTILEFGSPALVFGRPPKALALSALFAGLVEACVQGFFAYRIYTLSRSIYIPLLICLLASLQLAGSITITITGCQTPSLLSFLAQWGWLLTTDWSISAGNDVLVTVSLLTILIRHRSNALTRTAKLVDKLILWAVETGMLTSAAAIVAVIWFETFGTNFIWLAGHVIAPKVISNSLLANLNSRTALRAMDTIFTLNSVALPSAAPSNTVMASETSQNGLLLHDEENALKRSSHA
ncbi:hypothetical protein K438DRAFT_1968616 [Mycena galopus ATCC 62051]|nr:hypothetical protein K438DRAFT_1968616 [Mycena galopus ATCC 62051]